MIPVELPNSFKVITQINPSLPLSSIPSEKKKKNQTLQQAPPILEIQKAMANSHFITQTNITKDGDLKALFFSSLFLTQISIPL